MTLSNYTSFELAHVVDDEHEVVCTYGEPGDWITLYGRLPDGRAIALADMHELSTARDVLCAVAARTRKPTLDHTRGTHNG